jgi:N-acetylneuraminic acid mutarotase
MAFLLKSKVAFSLLSFLFVISFYSFADSSKVSEVAVKPVASKHQFEQQAAFSIDMPITNNAVAQAQVKDQTLLFSFAGLHSGKTYRDVSAKAFSVNLDTGEAKTIAALPDNKGRLASIAATVNNQIYLFGGYTVAADHSEVSTPEVYRYNPVTNSYKLVSNMPTPVDDSVALVYQNRFIYLISGWHNSDNVDQVQVYDSQENRWFNATTYPGNPVFGHAAGIVGNRLLVVDGVKVVERVNGKNKYEPSKQNWLGEIDPNNPAKITWKAINKHPFSPLYRMAAMGVAYDKTKQFPKLSEQGLILFAGGSDNPYNFNGIGYDGNSSEPSNKVFGFDLATQQWREFPPLNEPSMDHRGLLQHGQQFYIVGGMLAGQAVTNRLQSFRISQ